MNVSAKTKKQLEEALNGVIAQCPTAKQAAVISDLYIMLRQPSGELCMYDDDDHELCRCIVDEWQHADTKDVTATLQEFLAAKRESIEAINFLRPFSFVLVDVDHEVLDELYIVDDDTLLIPGELMEGLEDDLDAFLKNLMEE